MNAIELLKAQHDDVAALFAKLEACEQPTQKAALFEELAGKLVAHDAIEREIFYPACKNEVGMSGHLGEALAEHGLVEFALYVATQSLGRPDFDHKLTVLHEVVDHHVVEEQEELFPEVEEALGEEQLKILGRQMKPRFEAARSADFRAALFDNLRQVMTGALQTKPPRSVRPERTKRAANGAKASAHH